MKSQKPKLLLHTCCAPCLSGVYDQINSDYDITLFWFNANIHPLEEYIKRLEVLSEYANSLNLPLVIEGDYMDDHHNWLKLTQENSTEPEGGERCRKCIKYRLLKAGLYAANNNFDLFATTLSISPYKNTEIINLIGKKIAKDVSVDFLAKGFEENDGYKKSIKICKELGIYRQKYCGCEYSLKPANK